MKQVDLGADVVIGLKIPLLEVVSEQALDFVHESVKSVQAEALVPLACGVGRRISRELSAEAQAEARAKVRTADTAGRKPMEEREQYVAFERIRRKREQGDQYAIRFQHPCTFSE